jgi:hypothetical protein
VMLLMVAVQAGSSGTASEAQAAPACF